MRYSRIITLLLTAIIILSGCAEKPVSEKNGIRCEPWPETDKSAEPYVCLPERKPLIDSEQNVKPRPHSSGRQRETALDRMKAQPAGEPCDFIVFTKTAFADEAAENEYRRLSDAALAAENAYSAIEDKRTEEARSASENVKKAYAEYFEYLMETDLASNKALAERFAEAGCKTGIMAENHIAYGNITSTYAVVVTAVPEEFLELIKTVEGVAEADVFGENYKFVYTETVWEGEP